MLDTEKMTTQARLSVVRTSLHRVFQPSWILCREETGQDSLIVNFDTDLRSSFFAKLYQHSHLSGGHVVMLGSDQASR